LSYSAKIKDKIKQLSALFAEKQFENYLKIKKVTVEPIWKFPKHILPGILGPAISKSLYEKEGSMNNFEAQVIREIAALPNIVFWHRNLGKGKGFS
ncbi:hypothetical protein ABTF56_19885, partial [Acinetobacter baumannii]